MQENLFPSSNFQVQLLSRARTITAKMSYIKLLYNHIHKNVPQDDISVDDGREDCRKYCLIWVVVFFNCPKCTQNTKNGYSSK